MSRSTAVLISLASPALLAACLSNVPAPVIDRAPPTPTQAQAQTLGSETYTVKRGDTLYSIARDQRVDARELMAWNRLPEGARLSVGQIIRVKAPPSVDTAGAPVTDSGLAAPVLEGKPLTPPGHAAVITIPPTATNAASANNALLKTQPKGLKLPYTEQNVVLLQKLETPAPVEVSEPKPGPVNTSASVVNDGIEWAWPATGSLMARFSEGGGKGVEIAGREGEPVYAAAAGKVTYSGAGVRGYGNLVIIKHNEKYLSAYAHNKSLAVKQGQSVTRGQKIAELGSSGTDAAKLHFEIRYMGKPVDPVEYLPPRS